MHHKPHDQAHDQVQQRDQKTCNRIALDEFRGPVERPEKGGFLLFQFATAFRFGVVYGASGHIAVNRKLLSGHAIQGETRTDFGHACGTLCDHHKVHDQQDTEHHEAQKDRPPHDEFCEPFNHVARGTRSGVAFADDEFCRRHV